ncbi:hypothetical protein [Streptomyces sp. CBMA152]|uniref:hypothetical protein n=1 Tax=Streptomyces sp. CBMA152 TaxID=1896312 RepID=UPI001660B7E3|nr:hypothetical protein [Streptomyces sp. CBMA152]MBD0740892.1 hypothetical protein [Streptomyces sp. CBMA152]
MAHSTPPQPLTPEWISTHFGSLPFPARMPALARYARALDPAAYATLHRALDVGDQDERHTGLFLATARRDLDTVAAALDDPVLRRRALAAAIRLPVPEQALADLVLSDISSVRHSTYRVLRLSRRARLADRLLPEVYERHGAPEAARLLTACSPRVVDRWLPRTGAPDGVLSSLARTAPAAVAVLLSKEYGEWAGGPYVHRYAMRRKLLAAVVAERDPAAGLHLLRNAPWLIGERAAVALLRRPADLLEILRTLQTSASDDENASFELAVPPGPLAPTAVAALRALPESDLVELATRCPSRGGRLRRPGRLEVAADPLLALLPPGERRRLVAERARDPRGRRMLPSAFAALDPADRAEFSDVWLERWKRRPARLAALAVTLPLATVEPVLREQASRHRAHDRALAWPVLLACAELGGDPAEFARIALSCERAWHDQEEVRRHTLQQLAGTAGRLLHAVPEQVLRDVTMTVVESRDSTAATLGPAALLLRRAAESAAARGDRARAAYAAALLCRVVTDPRHTGSYRPLNVDLPTARHIWAATDPAVADGPGVRIALAALLAPHLTELPEAGALMRRTALEDEDPEAAARAAAVWITPTAVREERCAQLIAVDPSFAAVPEVLVTIAERRTDLLYTVLAAAVASVGGGRGLRGRIRPRGGAWVPRPRAGATGRWHPSQRQAWYDVLATVATDEHAPIRDRADAAAYLRSPARLHALAEHAPQPVAAAALTALGETGPATPDLLDTLLRHAGTGGVRGRAAVASVRRLLTEAPDGEAVRQLGPLLNSPSSPIGSRKEAARTLGVVGGSAAASTLLAAWDQPHQHRDVRAAIAPFLLRHVDHEDIVVRLVEGAQEPAIREAVITRAITSPAYLTFLTRLVRDGEDDAAAAACSALNGRIVGATEAVVDAARALGGAAVDPVRPRAVWYAAMTTLATAADPPADAAVREMLNTLVRRGRAALGASVSRAAALRRLNSYASVLHSMYGPSVAEERAAALSAALEETGLLREAARLAVDAALAALRRDDPAPERWAKALRLIEGHPARMPDVGSYGLGSAVDHPTETARLTARTLRERGTPAAGLLALALVREAGARTRWDEAWRAELDALRRHPDGDVAMEALLVEPVDAC